MNFRIIIYGLFFFSSAIQAASSTRILDPANNYTSRTFMFTQPLYHNLAAVAGAWDEVIACKDTPCQAAVQGIVLTQDSVDEFCGANGYFGMNCQSTMLVTGDDSPLRLERDIRAEYLGITDPNFEGTLRLQPRQKQTGALLEYNQTLGAFTDWCFIKDWWIDVLVPIFHVRNQLNTVGSSEEVVLSFIDPAYYLGNKLKFARITNLYQEKTGIGTIEIRLGGTFLNHDGFFLDYYSGVGIPAEDKPCPDYLFPATLGNNKHLVVLAGGHFKMPIICWRDTCNLRWFLEMENRFYVSNNQYRTFDLQNKQFSRYLPVRREGDVNTIPAANVLTRCVHVYPGSFVELITGLEFSGDSIACEIGYKLWAHSSEFIRVRECCVDTDPLFTEYGIADVSSPDSTASASKSTIAKAAPADNTFITIKEMDINYCSGAAGGSVTQGVHAALYYRNEYNCRDYFLGLGGFFQTPNNNAALQIWGLWFKVGSDF